jgi:hypothetical protein
MACSGAVYYEMMPLRQANADNKQQVRSFCEGVSRYPYWVASCMCCCSSACA